VYAGQVNDIHEPSGFAIRAATTCWPIPFTFQSSVRWSKAVPPLGAGIAAVVQPNS
jgi:hypothetical protein